MKIKKYRYFVGDFETTVYDGQKSTEVWASAIVPFWSEDVTIHHSINETFEYLANLKEHVIVYYHNLKFDGNFWLSYLLTNLKYEQAYEKLKEDEISVKWLKEKEMKNNTFKYSISNMGQWYSIIIKVNNHFIEIRDSLKLLPFSVKKIGDSFGTTRKKLEMEYTGYRYPGCEITDEEKAYISNDVLVVKEALEIMFKEGHDKLTIGSCCLSEFKKGIGKQDYAVLFPNVYDFELDKQHKYRTAGDWIRKSYRGGWCYLVKGKQDKIYNNGTTADVNSLYPSMMSSESGNIYPIGKPCFWYGNFIPDQALKPNRYYFIRIRTRFYLKDGMLPFIQIKGNYLYKGTEALETSDVYNKITGEYDRFYADEKGVVHDSVVELTLTMTDFELIKEHYELVDFQIIDGCWFYAQIGIFDEYIEHYKKQKLENTGALRELAKLFLNNLYGKLASSMDSSFKLAYVKEDGSIGFMCITENDKQPGYIPIGSAITSYARNFTIRTAQKNYYGKDKRGFIYADTDSIHCDLEPTELKGLTVHDKNFCCWKIESCWDEAIFSRQKTYIEHVTHEDCKPLEELKDKDGKPRKPYYNIKCAGMPKRCKDLFEISMTGFDEEKADQYNNEQLEFLRVKRTLKNFTYGLKIPGKLMPKRIKGGVLLVETTYEMREWG